MNRSLACLAVSSFVVTTDGTLVIGLLDKISAGVHASVAVAGQSVTVFAAGYAIGGPTLIAATRRWRPGRVLVTSLVIFVVANIGTGLATSVLALLFARAIAGTAAGTHTPAAAALAGTVGSERDRGRALAVVVGGASAASMIGVPLGTLLGAYLGWRAAFFAVATSATILLVILRRRAWPSELRNEARQRPGRLGNRAALVFATTLLWAAGSFTFFSYFAVVLRATAGVSTNGVAIFLFVFGVAGVGGALISGRATDARGPIIVIAVALIAIAGSLLGLAALARAPVAHSTAILSTGLLVGVYGLATWAVTTPQQHRLIDEGGDRRLLLSFNASALYSGVSVGAALGGALLAAGATATRLCIVAAMIELGALAALGLSSLTEGRRRAETS